jgi:transcriptional regulator with XRE-family HTH domain
VLVYSLVICPVFVFGICGEIYQYICLRSSFMNQLVTYNSLVGFELEKVRTGKGIDQEVLAQRCGMSQPVLSRLEKGKAAINIDQLFLICEALEISVNSIINTVVISVESIREEESVDVKTTKQAGNGAALLTGAAIGAVLGVLLSRKK